MRKGLEKKVTNNVLESVCGSGGENVRGKLRGKRYKQVDHGHKRVLEQRKVIWLIYALFININGPTLLCCCCCLVAKLCPTLGNSMD